MGRRFLDNRVFRALNRFDERVGAALERSWLGRLRRRIGARLARPYPPISELSRNERVLLGWVHIGRMSVSDPRLVPYLFGRVEAARRTLLGFGLPMFVVFGVIFVVAVRTDGGWLAGPLIIPMVSPAFNTWLYLVQARHAAAAHAHLLEREGAAFGV